MRVWFSKCSACNNEWSCVSIKKYKLTHICGILFPARHIIVRNELHDFTKVYLLCNLIYILCQAYRNSNCDQNSTIENDWKTWIPNKTKQNEKKQKPQHMNSFRNSNLQFSLLWGKKIHSKGKFVEKNAMNFSNWIFRTEVGKFIHFFFLSISRLWVLILRSFIEIAIFFFHLPKKRRIRLFSYPSDRLEY